MTPTQIAAIKGMLAYFDSGNNIPVDKAVIKANCAEVAALRAALAEPAPLNVDDLAQEIRRIDGSNRLGAGALAEALMPFVCKLMAEPAPVQGTSTCGRCVVFCQGGDGCLSGMSQITQIERERLVCGQLSRRTPPADVPMLTEILHAIDDAAVLADFAECWIKDPSIEGMHRLKNGGVKFRLLAQAVRQKAGLA